MPRRPPSIDYRKVQRSERAWTAGRKKPTPVCACGCGQPVTISKRKGGPHGRHPGFGRPYTWVAHHFEKFRKFNQNRTASGSLILNVKGKIKPPKIMTILESRRGPRMPKTYLTMVLHELVVDGKKTWRNCWHFAKIGADAGQPEMMRVMETWNGLRVKERERMTPEEVLEIAGVDPRDFAAEVFREYLTMATDASNLIEAANRPAIVKAAIDFAKKKDGWRDREMLFKHSSFLPQKSGGGIHVNANSSSEVKSAVVLPGEIASMESENVRMTRVLKADSVTVELASEEKPRKVPALSGRP